MTTRVLYLDTETTGTDVKVDQIIELGLMVPGEVEMRQRFRPTVPIHAEALAVHGITSDALRDEPLFDHRLVAEAVAGVGYVVGYNVGFDLQMIEAEFHRVGQPSPLAGAAVIDVYKLWRHLEPRNLASAHQRFVGAPLANAHSALVDAKAAHAVLHGMLDACGLALDYEGLADLLDPQRKDRFGSTDHLVWRDGVLRVNFGKHTGASLHDLGRTSRSYLEWMRNGTFPPLVKDACRAAMTAPTAEAFHAWARTAKVPGTPLPVLPPQRSQYVNVNPTMDETIDRERARMRDEADSDRAATRFMPGDSED